MATDKRKHAFWLTDEAKTMVEIDFQLDNCGSQSEFVEKAIRFYDGYVHANKTGAFAMSTPKRFFSISPTTLRQFVAFPSGNSLLISHTVNVSPNLLSSVVR